MSASRYPHKLRSIRARSSDACGSVLDDVSDAEALHSDAAWPVRRDELPVGIFRSMLDSMDNVDAAKRNVARRQVEARARLSRQAAERRAPNLAQMAEAIAEFEPLPARERVPVIRHFEPLGPQLPPAVKRMLETRQRELDAQRDHLALQVAFAASIDTTPLSDRSFGAQSGQSAWDDDDGRCNSIVGDGGAPWPLMAVVNADKPVGVDAIPEAVQARPGILFMNREGAVQTMHLEPGQKVEFRHRRTWAKPVIRSVSDRTQAQFQHHAGMGGRGSPRPGSVSIETRARKSGIRPYQAWFALPDDDHVDASFRSGMAGLTILFAFAAAMVVWAWARGAI